jgi:hypothetical protein
MRRSGPVGSYHPVSLDLVGIVCCPEKITCSIVFRSPWLGAKSRIRCRSMKSTGNSPKQHVIIGLLPGITLTGRCLVHIG